MKRRAARIAALGLSTISLMGGISMPMHVQAVVLGGGSVVAPVDNSDLSEENKESEVEEETKEAIPNEQDCLEATGEIIKDCEELPNKIEGIEGVEELDLSSYNEAGVNALKKAEEDFAKMVTEKEAIAGLLIEEETAEGEELDAVYDAEEAAANKYENSKWDADTQLGIAYGAFNEAIGKLDEMSQEIEGQKAALTAPVEEVIEEKEEIKEEVKEEVKEKETPISVRFYVTQFFLRFETIVEAYRYYGYEVVSDAYTYHIYGIVQIVPYHPPVEETVEEKVEEKVEKSEDKPAPQPSIEERVGGMDAILGKISITKEQYKNAIDKIFNIGIHINDLDPLDTSNMGSMKPPTPINTEIPVVEIIKEADVEQIIVNFTHQSESSVQPILVEEEELEEEELLEEEEEEILEEEQTTTGESHGSYYDGGAAAPETPAEPEQVPEQPAPEVVIEDAETPKGITVAGIMARGKWFVALGGVSTAGVGVGIFEAKRRAAMKILDKLNQ